MSEGTAYLDSWVEVYVIDSSFQNNRLHGRGGTIHVQVVSGLESPISVSHIHISHCIFSNNTLIGHASIESFGAAVYIWGLLTNIKFPPSVKNVLVEIERSTFLDNQAKSGGGALYFRGQLVGVVIAMCEFVHSRSTVLSSKGIFILGYSDICIKESSISSSVGNGTTTLVELNMLSAASSIRCLNFRINCVFWHKLMLFAELVTNTNTTKLAQAALFCMACAPSYYIPSDGTNTISYIQNDNKPSTQPDLSCVACPTGGECPGVEIKAKPNHWGLNTSEGVEFWQCPAEYCCAGTNKKPCSSHNTCAGKRDGMLCSSCKPGFSQSLLSNTGMRRDDCTSTWFWGLAVLASFVYMFWYTFKDDIMDFPVRFAKRAKHSHQPNDIKRQEQPINYIDKGYFGVLIYFVQATAVLRSGLSLYTADGGHGLFRRLETYVGLILTVELSYMQADICQIPNLSTTTKILVKFLFLLSIFGSWIIVFILFSTINILTQYILKKEPVCPAMKLKLIGGLVKIIKYSYGGLTKIVFFSLLCVNIGPNTVWFHDASVNCFSLWQNIMILFGICYVLPFPFMLFFGMKCLKDGKFSGNILLAGTCCPLPFFCLFLIEYVKICRSKSIVNCFMPDDIDPAHHFNNDDDKRMYKRFMRGYREEGSAQFWECVMFLKRLLLNFTTLIPDTVIKLGICLILCIIFLVHHIYVQPFLNPASNRVELVSLLFLCAEAASNLVKSIYMNLGIAPDSPHTVMLENISFIETLLLPSLLLLIFVFELQPIARMVFSVSIFCKSRQKYHLYNRNSYWTLYERRILTIWVEIAQQLRLKWWVWVFCTAFNNLVRKFWRKNHKQAEAQPELFWFAFLVCRLKANLLRRMFNCVAMRSHST